MQSPLPRTKYDVIVCGSLHLDIVVRAEAMPRLDETAVGRSWQQVCGGKGGNQAVQAARHGALTAFIGRVGRDDFADKLLANLDRAGVDRSAVIADPAAGSGMSVAIVNAQGEYGAVIVSGANLTMEPGSIAESWQRLGGARVLILQNEVPEAVNIAAATAARANASCVILNAAPARAVSAQLLSAIDILILNRVEAAMMSGGPVDSAANARAALTAIRATHPRAGRPLSVVITLGKDGLLIAPPGVEAIEIAPIPVTVVSSHGAGDCFTGVLARSVARGDDLVTACRHANAAASRFVGGLPVL